LDYEIGAEDKVSVTVSPPPPRPIRPSAIRSRLTREFPARRLAASLWPSGRSLPRKKGCSRRETDPRPDVAKTGLKWVPDCRRTFFVMPEEGSRTLFDGVERSTHPEIPSSPSADNSSAMQAYYEYVNVCVGTRERMAVLSDHARSWARMENGDPAAGRQAALSATRLDPDLAEGWWTLGKCNRKLDRIPEAIPAFQRAVQARPHEWRTHHYLGSCLLEAGYSAEAAPPLREVLAFGKPDRRGDSRQAIDRAIELDSQPRSNHLKIARSTFPNLPSCFSEVVREVPAARQSERT